VTVFDLSGETALVTGASSGLGAHFARVLAAHGAKVAMAARRVEKMTALAEGIAEAGGRALPIGCDVTDAKSIEDAVAAAETELGPVTLLVNNSGVAIPKKVLEHTEEDWDRVVDTNLKGAWLMSQAVARRLVALGRPGRIVNIASIIGLRTMGQVPSYAASKAGLIHLTRDLAMELARHDITVNAIAPGYIATEMNRDFLQSAIGKRIEQRIPAGRFGAPEDLDGALLLLLAPSGRYITGAVIPVDGGHLVSAL
jgi:NAD(P)-dependent dehydrogenase (short-subunit alcohol dehydrogenase family)